MPTNRALGKKPVGEKNACKAWTSGQAWERAGKQQKPPFHQHSQQVKHLLVHAPQNMWGSPLLIHHTSVDLLVPKFHLTSTNWTFNWRNQNWTGVFLHMLTPNLKRNYILYVSTSIRLFSFKHKSEMYFESCLFWGLHNFHDGNDLLKCLPKHLFFCIWSHEHAHSGNSKCQNSIEGQWRFEVLFRNFQKSPWAPTTFLNIHYPESSRESNESERSAFLLLEVLLTTQDQSGDENNLINAHLKPCAS